MTREAVRIIHEEHKAMSAMLQTLHLMSQRLRTGVDADFDLMRAMLFYLDEFPERLHHAKESASLFPKLRARAPEIDAVLERLEGEHIHGSATIREIEHLLLAFEQLGESRRKPFVDALNSFVDSYVHHMQLEETEVLPLALQRLSEDDWREIDAAFRETRDPLTGHKPSDEYQALFEKILASLPAPIGLGPLT